LLYNSARQDPATVSRLLAELREANRTTPALVNDEGDGPAALETLRRRLGWVPSWIHSFAGHGDESAALFRPELSASLAGVNPYEQALNGLPIDDRVRGRDPLNQALYLWAKAPLVNFILTLLGDRMEMAHSIEGRVPFLDHHVAEFAAGIPIELKIQGMREKHVLREAARDVLIEPVYNRQKQPFATPPTKAGADDAMLGLLGDVFASSLLDAQPIFDPKAVRSLFRSLPERPFEERALIDLQMHRVLSATLMHERFGMSG
jgi:asparagine synthase (glutamine-hydrolysing)